MKSKATATPPPIAIIVHGGAGAILPDYHQLAQSGCKQAALVGWRMLAAGGSALDAVEAAVRDMEDNHAFNAGTGSVLTSAGQVEMDAGIMDGESQAIGAVGLIRHFAHPISLARAVMADTGHYFLAGDGAEDFARARGFIEIAGQDLISERRWRQDEERASQKAGGQDTVGALALDADGNLAAANSTGGVAFKLPGRIGDSPIPGAGFYADNRFGAVVTTGQGEHIMRAGLAFLVMRALERGASAREAAGRAAASFARRIPGGQAGLIVLDATGRVGLAHTTAFMSHAYLTPGMNELVSGIRYRPDRWASPPF
jgi:beta-aspartyl-peptidase (threonine type)